MTTESEQANHCLGEVYEQKLRHISLDTYTRLPDREELVDERSNDDVNQTDQSSTKGHRGEHGIIKIVNHGADLGIG